MHLWTSLKEWNIKLVLLFTAFRIHIHKSTVDILLSLKQGYKVQYRGKVELKVSLRCSVTFDRILKEKSGVIQSIALLLEATECFLLEKTMKKFDTM